MTPILLFAAAAMAPQTSTPVKPQATVAQDVAEIATRTCYEVVGGRLRWDTSKLDEEEALLRRLGLQPGLPPGALDSVGRNLAASFNQAVLASRPSGGAQLLVAIGGMVPGCRVTATGAPGTVTGRDVAEALQRPPHGWTRAPALDRSGGAIERVSFVRRAPDGRPVLLDLLVVAAAEGNFRLMAMVHPVPPGVTLPPGF